MAGSMGWFSDFGFPAAADGWTPDEDIRKTCMMVITIPDHWSKGQIASLTFTHTNTHAHIHKHTRMNAHTHTHARPQTQVTQFEGPDMTLGWGGAPSGLQNATILC